MKDPNTELRSVRESIRLYKQAAKGNDRRAMHGHAVAAMWAMLDLDECLANGGELPDRWLYERLDRSC